MTVFLLWDKVREEHGELPQLVDVYATRESAEAMRQRLICNSAGLPDDDSVEAAIEELGYDATEDYEIEERKVNQ